MGDILHALPAITALRAAHPEWQIGWVVDPRWRGLLTAGTEGTRGQGNEKAERGAARPLVDQLHFAPAKEWGRRPLTVQTAQEIAALRRALRAGRYDAVIDLQGAIRSAVIARMAGTKRVIGEMHPRERAARRLFTERVATHGAHVIEQDIELASAIAGDALSYATPLLPVSPTAEAWAEAQLTHANGRPIALLTPGAGWGAKRWPPERYAAVAKGLAASGMQVLVNSGPGEELLAAVIAECSGGAARPVAASVNELIALTRHTDLCIGGDTGPLHLACALGRPVVGIYGPTDPSRNGPYGTRFTVLRSPLSRRDHSRRAEPEAGLLTITADDVLRAAETLLAGDNR